VQGTIQKPSNGRKNTIEERRTTVATAIEAIYFETVKNACIARADRD